MSDGAAEVGAKIKAFVMEELAPRRGVAEVTDDESLVDCGVVDSLGVFQLTAFLEETFGISITDDELTPENFRTLIAIGDFVRGKQERKR